MTSQRNLEQISRKLSALLNERRNTLVAVRYKEEGNDADFFNAFGTLSQESGNEEIVLNNGVNEFPGRFPAKNLSQIKIPFRDFVDYVVIKQKRDRKIYK